MIEITSIKVFVEIMEKIFSIRREIDVISRDKIQPFLDSQYEELKETSESYFALFAKLHLEISKSKNSQELYSVIEIIRHERDMMIFNRNSVISVFNAIRHTANVDETNLDDTNKRPIQNDFVEFLRCVESFFNVLSYEGPSSLTGVLARIGRRDLSDADFAEHKEWALGFLRAEMTNLEHSWKGASFHYSKFKLDESQTLPMPSKLLVEQKPKPRL